VSLRLTFTVGEATASEQPGSPSGVRKEQAWGC
jgi:hypothetical protein